MKIIKKLSLFLLVCFLFICFTSGNAKARKTEDVNYIYPAYVMDFDSFTDIELTEYFDYSFEGKILDRFYSLPETAKDGYVSLPMTYYHVLVTRGIKGETPTFVTVGHYGGYRNNGKLTFFVGMGFFNVGSYYRFHVYQDNEKTRLEGAFIAPHPKSAIELLEDPNTSIDTDLSSSSAYQKSDFSLVNDSRLPLSRVDVSGQNTSFETAMEVTSSTLYNFYLPSGGALYFKFYPEAYNYYSIYSLGQTDVKLYVYNINKRVITLNDNSNVVPRISEFTGTPNFFVNTLLEEANTYYLKVVGSNSTSSGSSQMKIVKDNWYNSSSIDALKRGKNLVRNGYVKYKDSTTHFYSYLAQAAFVWNKCNRIGITSSSSNYSVEVVEVGIDNVVLGYSGYTDYDAGEIGLNYYLLSEYSEGEILKTVLHEFGHALGLSDFPTTESTSNVMVQGRRGASYVGPADLATYRDLWG